MNWWDNNTNEEQMLGWVGDYTASSKVVSRKHIIGKRYKSILDCGAGLCSEYYGYKADGYKIKYSAIDGCEKFVERAKNVGINIVLAELDHIPFPDNSFDVVYIRHVLEHLPRYEDALKEAIRVTKKEVVVVFFIPPTDKEDAINFDGALYHNFYNKDKMVSFLYSLPEVDKIETQDVGNEVIWSISKK